MHREKRRSGIFIVTLAMVLIAGFVVLPAPSFAQQKVKVAWSIYVGWMPWEYAAAQGILQKWGDQYGIQFELVRLDYIPSVEAYVAKQVEACTMTNMECLDMPSASGIDSTVLIVGDYSNGNDAVLTRDGITMANIAGNVVTGVELSVSHYTIVRGLEMGGLREEDITFINTSDSDIGPMFLADTSQKVVVTWNPIVMQLLQAPGVQKIFDSSQIPGEIIDCLVIRTDVLKANPNVGKALVGAWYEVMRIMSQRTTSKGAIAHMAQEAGATPTEFVNQLKTTAMFYKPAQAVTFTTSSDLKTKMDFVRNFCFSHGLLGENARSVDVVGIEYPDGTIQGNASNVKMRFNVEFMQLAADGKL